ncbi:hypothetical protein DXG01_014848, partial [Tephrocybe rancida]
SKLLKYIPLPDFKMMWIPVEAPYMALIPRFKVFRGNLFSRLAINEKRLPLQCQEDGTYTLHKDVKDTWVALESNLRALCFAMLDLGVAYTPQSFTFWAFPRRYGYEKSYRTPRLAKFKILQSRDAFVPLMATLSMFLIIMDNMEALNPKLDWRSEVLKTTGIRELWLADLESSVVGDLNEPRIGGIIHVASCKYRRLLPHLLRAKMNLVLSWGDDPPVSPPDFLVSGGFVPSGRLIGTLRKQQLDT